MKQLFTLGKGFIFLFSIVFLFGISDSEACGCRCGTELVRFVWDGGEFIPIGGNPKGITITDVVTKPGHPDKPIRVSWTSKDWFICSVEFKHGRRYKTNKYNPHVLSGDICSPYCRTITKIIFCSDAPLPVEMTSFSASIHKNLTQLSWETATEVNNYGFEIERASASLDMSNSSSSGVAPAAMLEEETWEKIGFVEGHGNSNSPKYYSFSDPSISASGKYYYRLKQIDIDGMYEYSEVVEIEFTAPKDFRLNQNYPNPFNPSTTISYSIPSRSHVKLVVYNLFGEEVSRLVNETKEAGSYSVGFNGSNLASGMYIYTLEANNFSETKRFILLK